MCHPRMPEQPGKTTFRKFFSTGSYLCNCATYFAIWTTFIISYSFSHSHELLRWDKHIVRYGVPFRISLPNQLTVTSPVPLCMIVQNLPFDGHDSHRLQGLCFQCDGSKLSDTPYSHVNFSIQYTYHPIPRIPLSVKLDVTAQSDAWSLRRSRTRELDSLDDLPILSCQQQQQKHTTIAILYLDINACSLDLRQRFKLWSAMVTFVLSGTTNISAYPVYDDLTVSFPHVYAQHGLHICEEPDEYLSNLQLLASSRANTTSSPTNGMAVIWRIGCGAIPATALEPLALLEKRFVTGSVPLSEITNSTLPGNITKWIVGDLMAPRMSSYTTSREKRAVWNEPAGSFEPSLSLPEEGSGMLPPYRYSGMNPLDNYGLPHPIKSPTHWLQPISPVKITVHQTMNLQIPLRSFHEAKALHDLQLTLYKPLMPNNLTHDSIRSQNPPTALFGPEIEKDTTDWIAFDAKLRNVRLRPTPREVGVHQIILCAQTTKDPRACEPFLVTVRRPPPFRKNFILRIPSGVYWCYRVPIYWFEELKANTFDGIELTVNGDAPFSWDLLTAEVCIVTVLKMEQIITIFFYASNNEIAQSVEIEFRLSSKPPPVNHLITTSKINLKLQWPSRLKTYHLPELNRINATLAQALRVRTNPKVTPSTLFIYDVIQFFASQNGTESRLLEMEWLFLPYGIPAEFERDLSSPSVPSIASIAQGRYTGPESSVQLGALQLGLPLQEQMKMCKESIIDGADVALKTTEESFRPFVLLEAELIEMKNSACAVAKRYIEKSQKTEVSSGFVQGGSNEFNRLRLNSASSSFSVNWRSMPEVVTNFTVSAGVSFKKQIHPEKAVPIKRMQYMEIVDSNGMKLDDSAWLGLTADNTHLYGIPLKNHIRKQPYMFAIQIYSVDRKSPTMAGFAIEVMDWFSESSLTASEKILPNHRVRLRILPTSWNRNWATSPVVSLEYRWRLSIAIDQFLQPDCPPPCSPDVGIWELDKYDGNTVFVIWAQLSLLLENKHGQSMGLTSYTSQTSSAPRAACPWDKIGRLQARLTALPTAISVEKNIGSVTGYTTNPHLFLSPWSAPSVSFREHLLTTRVGNVEAAVVDLMGACAQRRVEVEQTSVDKSNLYFDSQNELNELKSNESTFTIYTGEGFRYKILDAERFDSTTRERLHLFDSMGQRIGSSNWIGLEDDKSTIYGIVIGNAVQPSRYQFKICTNEADELGVRFSVYVAGSNPNLPAIHNHRVIMRFGTESGEPSTGGHSLLDRWRLVSALDSFLRPDCGGDESCTTNMDVLLLTFNYQALGFTVIWAQKSLLLKDADYSSSLIDPQQEAYEQKRHWDKWVKQSSKWSTQTSRRRRAAANIDRFVSSSYRQKSQLSPAGCPEKDIVQLERRLLGDTGFDLHPLPEFAQHLKMSKVGVLKEVHIERLGPCAKNANTPLLFVPEASILNQQGVPIPDSYRELQKETVVESHAIPNVQGRQRLILLGIFLPVCLMVIVILFGVLGMVWLRKRRSSLRRGENVEVKLPLSHSVTNPETERMLEQEPTHKGKMKSCDMDTGVKKGSATLPKRQKSLALGTPEATSDNCSAPTKPLILRNERPPEYDMTFTDSQVNNVSQMVAKNHTMSAGLPVNGARQVNREMPKVCYEFRPNPYRNLPPPIDPKPGMIAPGPQVSFISYHRPSQSS